MTTPFLYLLFHISFCLLNILYCPSSWIFLMAKTSICLCSIHIKCYFLLIWLFFEHPYIFLLKNKWIHYNPEVESIAPPFCLCFTLMISFRYTYNTQSHSFFSKMIRSSLNSVIISSLCVSRHSVMFLAHWQCSINVCVEEWMWDWYHLRNFCIFFQIRLNLVMNFPWMIYYPEK